MVQAAAAALAVPCGGRRPLGEESQVDAANGQKHDDRHFILLGARYAQTLRKCSSVVLNSCQMAVFVLPPTAVILLILLSQITSQNLFALYVMQVSNC